MVVAVAESSGQWLNTKIILKKEDRTRANDCAGRTTDMVRIISTGPREDIYGPEVLYLSLGTFRHLDILYARTIQAVRHLTRIFSAALRHILKSIRL